MAVAHMLLPQQTEPVVPVPGGFRRWLRSDMLVLRWVFAALYTLFIAAVVLLVWTGHAEASLLVLLGIMLAGQALLIFGSGTIRLCHPIRRRRLLIPVVTAALMLTVLVAGMFVAAWELLYLDRHVGDSFASGAFFATVGVSWIGWGWLLFLRLRNRPRHTVLAKLTTWLFAGSLAELLAAVPAHVIVSRRPGCFVGLGTMMGIIAGVSVMLFSFGPAIVLLFLRPRHRAAIVDGTPYCPSCGYDLRASQDRCPECGVAIENAHPPHGNAGTP